MGYGEEFSDSVEAYQEDREYYSIPSKARISKRLPKSIPCRKHDFTKEVKEFMKKDGKKFGVIRKRVDKD